FEEQWNEGFEYLKKYVEKYGHSKVPSQFKDNDFNLGMWVSTQRKRKDKTDLEKQQQLESLPQWSWDILEDQWNEAFNWLKKYTEEEGHARVTKGLEYNNFNLGTWVSSQRYTKDNLDLEKIKKLESLPKWSWNIIEDQWHEGFSYLKKHVEKYGHARVPQRFKYDNYSLGRWVGIQRKNKKNNKLDLEKIKNLESLPQWSWGIKPE
ncbi:MAG: helicase associated domain-containing protein, partial [Methylococcaceae bacterium]|nr:helicase associated domain-containing protein [Methylococcaceae bacterium]